MRAGRLAAGAVALALGAGAGVVLVRAGGATGDPRTSSRDGSVGGAATRLDEYAVLYRVVTNGVPTWQLLRARRPGAGADLVFAGGARPGPGDRPTGGSISTPTALYAVQDDGVRLASGRQPGPAAGDTVLGVVREELVRRGVARDLGRAHEVAGRRCTVLRVAEPVSGPVEGPGTDDDHDDLCVDADGLVLSETWVLGGRTVLTRRAEQVLTGAAARTGAVLPAVPSTDEPLPAPDAAGVVTAAPGTGTAVQEPQPPAGWSALLPPQAFVLPDPATAGEVLARSTVWSFRRGPDLLTVEVGRSRQLPWPPDGAGTRTLALPGLGPATTALRSDGPEVRVVLPGGDWVRVRGTVPLKQVADLARSLRAARG